MKLKNSLIYPIIGAVVLIIISLTLTLYFIVNRSINNLVSREELYICQIAKDLVKKRLGDEVARLSRLAAILQRDRLIANCIVRSKTPGDDLVLIRELLDDLSRKLDTHIFQVIDDKKRVIYSAYNTNNTTQNRISDIRSIIGVTEALLGRDMTVVNIIDEWMVNSIMPVRHEGNIIGAILLGTVLDDSFLKEVREDIPFEIDISLSTLGVVIASTVSADQVNVYDFNLIDTAVEQRITLFERDSGNQRITYYESIKIIDQGFCLVTTIDTTRTGQLRRRADMNILGAASIILIIAISLSVIFNVKLIKPLKALRSQVEHTALELSGKRVKKITGNEVVNLAFSFNAMTRAFWQQIDVQKKTEAHLEASLEEKEVLLREIHHRVKNNLQVISSMLNMQSRCAKDKQAIAQLMESRDRIHSMALVHENLYRSENMAEVKLDAYIRDLADNLFQSYDVDFSTIKLKINADKIFLGIDQAIPCGLIINELVSNALKHAFKGRERGEIQIDFHNRRNDRVVMLVSDNGVGMSKGSGGGTAKTLGLRLVNTLIKQLDAAMEIDNSSGTTFRIIFRKKSGIKGME